MRWVGLGSGTLLSAEQPGAEMQVMEMKSSQVDVANPEGASEGLKDSATWLLLWR